MNILVISHMYPSVADSMSGIFVHQQVKQLIREGHRVKVVSPKPFAPFPLKYLSSKWKGYSSIPVRDVIEGVEVYYPRNIEIPRGIMFSSSGMRMFAGIKKTVDIIHDNFKFDIIHAHVALPDGCAGMLAARKYKVPLIVTIHGQDMQYTIHENNKSREIIKNVINSSFKTIMVSKKLKGIALSELSIPENKIEVIGNGIDIGNLRDKGNVDNRLVEGYKGKRVILSASNLISLKGIDFNIKAVKKLSDKFKDMVYLIIGDGPERRNLENLACDLGISDKIEFLGQLPHEEVMKYMAICDIFSMPSWNEGFGMAYIEAMSSGKPIIACEGQGIQDVVTNGINGMLVKPKDVDSLAEAMEFLLAGEEERKKIGNLSRDIVLNEYTWVNNVNKTLKVYEEAIKLHNTSK